MDGESLKAKIPLATRRMGWVLAIGVLAGGACCICSPLQLLTPRSLPSITHGSWH